MDKLVNFPIEKELQAEGIHLSHKKGVDLTGISPKLFMKMTFPDLQVALIESTIAALPRWHFIMQ